MKKLYIIVLIFYCLISTVIAKENIKPTVNPSSFNAFDEITVTYNVSGTSLASLENTYIWVWIPGSNLDAKYNINPASSDSQHTENVKFTKSVDGDKTFFSITFVPQNLFKEPICNENQIGMLLKGNDWNDGQTVDHIATITPLQSCFVAKLLSPAEDPAFVVSGGIFSVKASSSENAVFSLTIDGVSVNTQAGLTDYSYDYSVSQNSGTYPASLQITGDNGDTTITFSFSVNEPSEIMTRPAGIIPGINYDPLDDSKVTLCLLAPGKEVAYVLGEFNNFTIAPDYKMYRDGNYFWKEIAGLTPGTEYAYQYLVNGIYIADPFADKILDPDDKWIPESIYPDLKAFPESAKKEEWYKNRLSVIKTGQSEYNWQHNDYSRPKKDDLVIYELLIRDFFAEEDRSYQNLIDTLSYFKSLGINAIELMPVQEFSGNDSWGYNPTFMFAPDKAYGTKEALKQFIDAAHAEGIAVILDIVFNHQEFPNPYVALWFDYQNYKVTPENPMFNVSATHPFSVFYDMNHESELTKFYMDTTLHYWINEYNVDGFRFDLSKGFTQNTGKDPGNVGAWGNYDQSRIDILKRMADEVWSYSPDTWLILEHFADNSEEKELSSYDFLLWGNIHSDYKEAILGYPENKSIEWAYFETRDWSENNLVSYMESHDEERQVYDALNHGNSAGSYNVQELNTALDRIKLASAFFFTIPGPKMLWQFGELGYDISINEGGRTSAKPVKWEYYSDEERKKLYNVFATLIKLRTEHPLFETGNFSWNPDGKIKTIRLSNDTEQAYIIGNFDVVENKVKINLPVTGTWYDLFTKNEIQVGQTEKEIILQPGEFHVFTTFPVENVPDNLTDHEISIVTGIDDELPVKELKVYPNPGTNFIKVKNKYFKSLNLYNLMGHSMMDKVAVHRVDNEVYIDISLLSTGIYLLKVDGSMTKIVKQ